MAQPRRRTQQPPMSMQVFDQQVQQALLNSRRPYTPEQVSTIMSLARRMASGRNVAVSQSWLDVNDLNRVASVLANGRARPRERRSLVAGLSGDLHGPIGSPRIRAVPRRTPERTYAYRVTLGNRTYEVVSGSEMLARSGSGSAGLARSRIGQLRRALVEGTPAVRVYTVTSEGQRGAELTDPQRQRFARAYVSRYNRMEQSLMLGQSPDRTLITISSVRRRPSGG